MAQSELRTFFPVRRRRDDDSHTAAKRRKLTESSRLDLPSQTDSPSSLAEQDVTSTDGGSKCEVSAPPTRRSTRSRKGTTTTAKKTPSTRGRRSKKGVTPSTDVPNIQTLFKLINKASASSDSSPVTKTAEKEELSDECPLPKASSASSSKETTPQASPFKVPSTRQTLTKAKCMTPKSSPLKESITSSPIRSSPVLETRGARLLRLAKEKMATKSPNAKAASVSEAVSSSPSVQRVTKMAARRKLLTSAPPPTTSSEGKTASRFLSSSSREKDRQEVVGDLYKLSKKELAQQTRFESKQKQKKESIKEKEVSKSPKLREFGAFVFESPTKNEANKTR